MQKIKNKNSVIQNPRTDTDYMRIGSGLILAAIAYKATPWLFKTVKEAAKKTDKAFVTATPFQKAILIFLASGQIIPWMTFAFLGYLKYLED